MSRDHNPQAFPGYYGETQAQAHPGMSLGEWYAGQALAGYIAMMSGAQQTPDPTSAALWCHDYADAMMAERAKRRAGRAKAKAGEGK